MLDMAEVDLLMFIDDLNNLKIKLILLNYK